jgi:3-hydroxymyristoyl/3-hydroxydecanoyl-(acyl carrier protein) dehydratase
MQTGGPARNAHKPPDPPRGGSRPVRADGGPPVFTRQQILAYARGRPSEAFGPRYAPFDEGRFLARLPSPPYSFIDRVVRVEPPAQVMAPGGWVEAEFVVDPDAWYFRANRSASMPYCVLQEAALQVCGFTAAYVGSSLTSEKDLRFRNLGGEAVQLRDVGPSPQVLTARCRLTRVNTAADMIIQDYRMAVLNENGQPVYEGSTHFGFFTEAALARQVGIRDAEQFAHNPGSAERARAVHFDLEPVAPLFPEDPDRAPVDGPALPAKALLMIDRVLFFVPDGGPHGLGCAKAEKSVDPGEWFFAAHFFQDPVCPGSLGLESFLQFLKFAALRRFGISAGSRRFAPFLGENHRWTYRGQILPTNGKITVEAVVTRIEEVPEPMLVADGLLRVDGLIIYRMENFGVRLVSDQQGPVGH